MRASAMSLIRSPDSRYVIIPLWILAEVCARHGGGGDSPNGSSPRVRAYPSLRSLGSSPEPSRPASTRSTGSFASVGRCLKLDLRAGSEWTAL